MDWNNKSSALWDEQAERWNAQVEMWKKGPRAEVLDFFFKTVGDGTPKVLDLGCGPGISTKIMNDKGYAAIGVDQSESMVMNAKERDVEAFVCANNRLPFEDHTFDSVFACTSLEWTDEPHLLIKEVSRVLKPGGSFVAVTLGPYAGPRKSAYDRLYGKTVIHNMMMPWELHQLLEEHAFETTEMQGAYSGKHSPNSNVIDSLQDNWIAKSALAFLWAFANIKK